MGTDIKAPRSRLQPEDDAGSMLPLARIPFSRPTVAGGEVEAMAEAVRLGHLTGDGPATKACERYLEEILAAPRVLLTTSCTHALEMAALLLDLRRGDEIILPSFTFVSTANAFLLRQARVIFADIRPDTLNLDERALPRLITKRTRAIVPVHYAGVGSAMDDINRQAAERGIAVVEDNAHGLFGSMGGRALGSFGSLATLSFHGTKNITCGEGGALVINEPRLIKRAEIIREKGTDRKRFTRGEVDRYGWMELGSSWVPSDLLAAFLLVQLRAHTEIQRRRREIWTRYETELQGWARCYGFGLPFLPPDCDQAFHMFYLLCPSEELRSDFIRHLGDLGIQAVSHYPPLHLSAVGRRLGGRPGACPVSEDISGRLVRLPFFTSLSDQDQRRVVRGVQAFKPRASTVDHITIGGR